MEASVVTPRGLATALCSGHLTQRYRGVDTKRVGSLIPPYSQLDDPKEHNRKPKRTRQRVSVAANMQRARNCHNNIEKKYRERKS
ncbi:unnamed protein product [Fusarium venenatum]|uniref:Uncharacterized protein n=1 Tax=Fusarium venenatum TaxID=56646 RepID=A0A2L2TUJ2_9HYPO|nr:uncharacterized protein FVRRES_04348 [Fusarium venenatum]CEI67836.1 unnamed protein product [Fusarium venenatum]